MRWATASERRCSMTHSELHEHVESLRQRIYKSFADVTYPGDDSLVNSREGAEPLLLGREFQGMNDWRDLDDGFIDQAPDGFGSALSFFSDEAFRFYLPAYLLADIAGGLHHSDPVFHLCHGLDDRSQAEPINRRRYGEQTWHDYATGRFAQFSQSQRAAIAAYLRYKRDTGDGFDRAMIDQALNRYWERAAR